VGGFGGLTSLMEWTAIPFTSAPLGISSEMGYLVNNFNVGSRSSRDWPNPRVGTDITDNPSKSCHCSCACCYGRKPYGLDEALLQLG
jgi:hypothetical protein